MGYTIHPTSLGLVALVSQESEARFDCTPEEADLVAFRLPTLPASREGVEVLMSDFEGDPFVIVVHPAMIESVRMDLFLNANLARGHAGIKSH